MTWPRNFPILDRSSWDYAITSRSEIQPIVGRVLVQPVYLKKKLSSQRRSRIQLGLEAITVFIKNIVHAAFGKAWFFIETASGLLVFIAGRANRHFFLLAKIDYHIRHYLYLSVYLFSPCRPISQNDWIGSTSNSVRFHRSCREECLVCFSIRDEFASNLSIGRKGIFFKRFTQYKSIIHARIAAGSRIYFVISIITSDFRITYWYRIANNRLKFVKLWHNTNNINYR